jgi:hypothetical protein
MLMQDGHLVRPWHRVVITDIRRASEFRTAIGLATTRFT